MLTGACNPDGVPDSRGPPIQVAATRGLSPGPRTLCIGNGTFYLDATLVLTPEDSHLSITGAGGTWLSGAKNVPGLQWEQYKVAPATPGTLQSYNDTDNQAVRQPSASRLLYFILF